MHLLSAKYCAGSGAAEMTISQALPPKGSQGNRVDRQLTNNESHVIRKNKILKEQERERLKQSMKASRKWTLELSLRSEFIRQIG